MAWKLAASGVVLFLLSTVTYSAVISFLSRFEADGNFDSLLESEYCILVIAIRVIGLLCLLAGGAAFVFQKKLINWLPEGRQASGWTDIREVFHSSFNWREDKTYLIGLIVVMLCGIAIRLLLLQRPVGYDEAYTFIKFASRELRYIVTDYSGPNNHIFHSLLVWLSTQLFGNHLWVLRLPAFLAGILCIPVGYAAGKKLFHPLAGLGSAAGICLMPVLIDYSNNARGYTLICLFALMGLWLATELIAKNSPGVWSLFSLTSILGFYTIPTYLYPFAVINLWLILSFFLQKSPKAAKSKFLMQWMEWGIFTGLIVLLIYSPVLVFGTGLHSIVGNEFVQSLNWHDFQKTLFNRIPVVWADWWFQIPAWIKWSSVVGFAGSIPAVIFPVIPEKEQPFRLHLILPVIIAIGLMLLIQRVVPLARVWMFLLDFYLVTSAIGFAWLFLFLTERYHKPVLSHQAAAGLIILLTLSGLVLWAQDPKNSQVELGFDYSAARYLTGHLVQDDHIFAVAPASMRVAYYLKQMGIPLDRYYDRDRPEDVRSGYIVVIEKSKYGTPQSILEFLHLSSQLGDNPLELVFKEKRMELYRVSEEQ